MSLKCHLEYNPSHLKFTKEDTLFSHYMLSYKSSLLGDIGSTHKHCSTGNWGLKCLIQTYIIHPQSWRVCIMRHATNLVRLLPQYTLMDTFFTLQGAWFPASFLLIKIRMDNCRVSVHNYILTEGSHLEFPDLCGSAAIWLDLLSYQGYQSTFKFLSQGWLYPFSGSTDNLAPFRSRGYFCSPMK